MSSRALRSLSEPRSPLPLALLRMAVCLIILLSPEPDLAMQIARAPSELWLPPPSMAWFLPIFRALAPHLELAHRLLEASALLALLGLWTRFCLGVLACTFVLLFGGAQLSGAVLHDMHLLWMVLLLWVTPSAQVLSLDAWRNGTPLSSAPPSSAAALGTFFARLLLGLIYFFPGLHKLLEGGADWASSANLQHQLWLKWFQAGGEVPWPRIDRFPHLLAAGGVAVLIFELGFVFCALSRRARGIAAGAGLTFHALTQHFMYIRFPSLWACYVCLWDGPRTTDARTGDQPGTPAAPRAGSALGVLLVGSGLVLPVCVQGALGQTQAWPFACYPSFAEPAPDAIFDLAVEVHWPDGTERLLRIGPLPPSSGRQRSPRAWSTVWRLAGLYGEPSSPPRLLAFASVLAGREQPALAIAEARGLHVYVESYATAPEAYGKPPRSRVLIHCSHHAGVPGGHLHDTDRP